MAAPPWVELPREITGAILHKLGMIEILTTARNVFTTWWSVCQDPAMWRCIVIRYNHMEMQLDFEKMCRHAVDLSQGLLTDISIEHYGTDDLLLYISQRFHLQLIGNPMTNQGLHAILDGYLEFSRGSGSDSR